MTWSRVGAEKGDRPVKRKMQIIGSKVNLEGQDHSIRYKTIVRLYFLITVGFNLKNENKNKLKAPLQSINMNLRVKGGNVVEN